LQKVLKMAEGSSEKGMEFAVEDLLQLLKLTDVNQNRSGVDLKDLKVRANVKADSMKECRQHQ
jgi:hypothetical protein